MIDALVEIAFIVAMTIAMLKTSEYKASLAHVDRANDPERGRKKCHTKRPRMK